ncbi:MAG: hypothetical protein ACRD5E_02060 [Nitrososphaeraceae archaeon]
MRLTKQQVFTTILILVLSILFIGDLHSISKASEHSSLSFSDPLSIKIIYPKKDQSTDIGSNLVITGTSRYNPDRICNVSVIINDVKPYQKAIPTGTETTNDYSTWKYALDLDYTTINEATNKITTRLLCSDDQGKDLRKWYSINIVGQDKTDNSYQSSSATALAVPIIIETESTTKPAIINIDRNAFVELINKRIENNTGVIRDTIEDSIMSLYTRMTLDNQPTLARFFILAFAVTLYHIL